MILQPGRPKGFDEIFHAFVGIKGSNENGGRRLFGFPGNIKKMPLDSIFQNLDVGLRGPAPDLLLSPRGFDGEELGFLEKVLFHESEDVNLGVKDGRLADIPSQNPLNGNQMGATRGKSRPTINILRAPAMDDIGP
jgi:hypothetical protein